MAAKRVKDLAVKTGSYTVDGETKNRYLNVGSMMKSDDGSFFLLLNKTFNPAGVPGDSDHIIVSVFDLRDSEQPRQAPATRASQPLARHAAPAAADDDIPF